MTAEQLVDFELDYETLGVLRSAKRAPNGWFLGKLTDRAKAQLQRHGMIAFRPKAATRFQRSKQKAWALTTVGVSARNYLVNS